MKPFFLIIIYLVPAIHFVPILHAGDYQNRADIKAFVMQMAKQSDYSEAELISLFAQVKQQSHLFDRLNRPAEKTLQWQQYREIFIQQKRIDQGVRFWRQHEPLLATVAAQTGVPVEIIVAIIGVETFFGLYQGKDPVFDSLVTIAFDYPARARFFRGELEQFLLLAREQNLHVRSVKGSYAGAMGMPQFIASSYRHYAVDGDGDGRVDLFDNIADITHSVANYFVRHGWRQGEMIATPLVLGADHTVASLDTGIKPQHIWADFVQHGLTAKPPVKDHMPVALIKLGQHAPEYWAGFNNFYTITRYNHSAFYAMAVYQLSELIKSGMETEQ